MRLPPLRNLVLPFVLALIIAARTVAELVLIAADLGLVGSPAWRANAYANGAFWAGLLGNWRPNYAAQPALMFVSYAFLHAGWQHLLGNMLVLAVIGRALCGRAGQWGFLAIYGAGIIGGGAGFALLGTSPRPMVGASGALFALVGAWLAWEAIERRESGRSRWPVWRDVAGLALLNLVFWIALDGVLAWETHLGGFLAGAAAGAALHRRGVSPAL